MAEFYKITEAAPLGEPWESHGKQNQTYWCKVEGEELAVSIGKQLPATLSPGQHVYGDLMRATSQKGTKYWKFKGAIVPEGVQRPTDSTPPASGPEAYANQWAEKQGDRVPDWFMPYGNMIMQLHKTMFGEGNAKLETVVAEKVEDKPNVDNDTQRTLDIMFGPEPTDIPEGDDGRA